MKIYRYGLTCRPPMPGAVPRGFIDCDTPKHPNSARGRFDFTDFRWGTIDYDRKLTDEELAQYELTPVYGECPVENQPTTKLIEFRDHATCILFIATRLDPQNPEEKQFLRNAGYGMEDVPVWFVDMNTRKAKCSWDLRIEHERLSKALAHFAAHWDDMPDNGVLDARVVLGETDQPAKTDFDVQVYIDTPSSAGFGS